MIAKAPGKNPFSILGVSPTSSFETIQQAFRNLALQYHPDVNRKASKNNRDHFVKIRLAYERIRDGDYRQHSQPYNRKGKGIVHNFDQQQYDFSEESFLRYFYQQTGIQLSSKQRQELLHLHYTKIPSGRYDGPSWDIARRLATEQEIYLSRRQKDQFSTNDMNKKTTWTASDTKQQQSHNFDDNNNDSSLRRKRRR